MQSWKVPIVSRIGLPNLSEDVFNRVWDGLDDDTRKALDDGNSLLADSVFIRDVFSVIGWQPVADVEPVPVSDAPAKACAASMEFGNALYVGLVTDEMWARYSGTGAGKISSPDERRRQTADLRSFIAGYSDYAVKTVLYGYDLHKAVPHDLNGEPPSGWREQIKWLDNIVHVYAQRLLPPIDSFRGKYACFSNFFKAPVVLDGVTYPTVENAFQAAKTFDEKERARFVDVDPSMAKRLGRRVKLRSDWEQVKTGIMRDLLKQKFAPGTQFRRVLDSTMGCTLIEGNTWHDNFWGDCHCARCSGREGKNTLGRLLMAIRDTSTEG